MKVIVLDIETTFKKDNDGKLDVDPYTGNMLVSVGYSSVGSDIIAPFTEKKTYRPDIEGYLCFTHTEKEPTEDGFATLQKVLDDTDILVGHNIKFDLKWLLACNFTYTGKLYDTMIAEYVIHGGDKVALSLAESVKRYGLDEKRTDLTEQYMKDGVSFDSIPWDIVEEYGRADVEVTKQLYLAQQKDVSNGLAPTVGLMNEMCQVLTEMENTGMKVSVDALTNIREQYRNEYNELNEFLDEEVKRTMGDTPINLDSPEDRSKVLYSRAVTDKKLWASTFNLGYEQYGSTKRKKRVRKYKQDDFIRKVRTYTTVVPHTESHQCSSCKGRGYFNPLKKDGTIGKAKRICKTCGGDGVVFKSTGTVAGFKLVPRDAYDVSTHGFKTDRPTLEILSLSATDEQKKFISSYIKYNAIGTYLRTFVDGIEKGLDSKGFIHPHYMQCVTATGRLSSRNPNFQNMPRGTTFPVRECVVSRWQGGKILEGDYSQLEFRVAGFLANDEQVYADVQKGFDVHSFSAEALGVSRQEAKAHTFKPLYGGTYGTEKEVEYYDLFKARYSAVARWHISLQNEAIKTKKITLPSGRVYHFPHVRRNFHGGSTHATAIKNYPVQGFATADLLPLALINLRKILFDKGMQSVVCNTVHDSIVLDVFPAEEKEVIEILAESMLSIKSEAKKRYNIDYDMPVGIELKIGKDWLNMEEVLTL